MLNALPVVTSPSMIRVPEDYPTIQAAINAATSGKTIDGGVFGR